VEGHAAVGVAMTFRSRLQISSAMLAIIAIGALALGVRYEMTRRLTAEYQRRVLALVDGIEADLVAEGQTIAARLRAFVERLADDNRFRLALSSAQQRSYVLDYAGSAMRVAGLSMLQIQEPNGRIISSGHFRNEFDRVEADLARSIAMSPRASALAEARTPTGPFLALVGVDSARVAGTWLTVVGGVRVGSDFLRGLARDDDLTVTLATPAGTLLSSRATDVSGDVVASEFTFPFVIGRDAAGLSDARWVVTQSTEPLALLRRSVDRWSLVAGLVVTTLAVLVATWMASRLSRPLVALADKTRTLDLTKLDVTFDSERTDEIGVLARMLGSMTRRLRVDAQRLREAERRATVGEVARQVNHDIKNGLVPIRNVLRHFANVADENPEELPTVFRERSGTLESGVEYLETLAANYARLSPKLDGGVVSVRAVVDDVVRGMPSGAVDVVTDVAGNLPKVRSDAVVLRRILENLVGNAIDAARGTSGGVTVAAYEASDNVRIVVRDTGPGMSDQELERAFEDFYTTKPDGTGLGLSIVRRLVLDLEGSLKVETEPGVGTSVLVDLPAAVSQS
jgi:signal transduction histidine kinase